MNNSIIKSILNDGLIHSDQDHEISYWSEKLGVSKEVLLATIRSVGPLLKDVIRALTN